MNTLEQEYDIVVIGGGTAGPMAAIKAKEHDRELRVLLVDKANVKRSGAISMGMDGLNNAIVPGHATAEQYTREITVANDGIVNQAAVYAYASHSFETLRQLDRWGVRFEKDETGDYAVKKVHHMGAYVLPMPEGHDIKKVLYRQAQACADPHRQPPGLHPPAHRCRGRGERRTRFRLPQRRLPCDPRQGGDPLLRRGGPPGPAVLGLPDGYLREPDQRRRRLRHGLSCRRRAWPTWNASRSTR